MDKNEKRKIVYESRRDLNVYYFGIGYKQVSIITYIVRIKLNWLTGLFHRNKYTYIIKQNDPSMSDAFYDIERASNRYIQSTMTSERALAELWLEKNNKN